MRASRSLRLAFVATVLAVSPVAAQDYPTKTVRIIVPFTPGGGNDIVARFLGKYMTEMHRQQY
ncbi:MAG: tripartite tricarboxylate transporter substrate binding protein, partial [Burkholderiales bacterium]